MNNDNRVLGRRGAKELTPSETDHVMGGVITLLTVCTIPQPGMQGCDGDKSF